MSGHFDSAVCAKATLDDLASDRIRWFVTGARRRRGPDIPKDATPQDLLERLHLLSQGRLTNAAVILFGRDPHRLLALPPIKCLHFQGPTGATLLNQQSVCKGTIFGWIFEASFFALKGLSRADPSRWDLPSYDIPKEAVHEAVLNALVHQDYSSAIGMQVAIYSDRLEIFNPGALPPSLTLDQLRRPHSSGPGNPLLAQTLCPIENMDGKGVGTTGMIEHCRKAGLPEPEFKLRNGFLAILHRPRHRPPAPPPGQAGGQEPRPVPPAPPAPTVPDETKRLLMACQGEMTREQLQKELHLSSQENFRKLYLLPALQNGLVEMTIPDKPNSRLQKYRLTAKGKAVLASLL